jgi:transposase
LILCARGEDLPGFEPDQILLLPPSLNEWLPEDHLARFVAELVDQVLDLSAIYADYREVHGYPPYDPRLMLRLLIYGHTIGVRSSRAIASSGELTTAPTRRRRQGEPCPMRH